MDERDKLVCFVTFVRCYGGGEMGFARGGTCDETSECQERTLYQRSHPLIPLERALTHVRSARKIEGSDRGESQGKSCRLDMLFDCLLIVPFVTLAARVLSHAPPQFSWHWQFRVIKLKLTHTSTANPPHCKRPDHTRQLQMITTTFIHS
jgi:hypothetical protein